MAYKQRDDRAVFMAKVEPDTNGGCWLWSGAGKRYGKISLQKKVELAHRASWILHQGPIPAGMFVCHKCDTPRCVNPDHLFLGSAADNTADMMAKGRWGGGEKMKKIAPEDVSVIKSRRLSGERPVDLAAEYGITESYVRFIANGARGAAHVV